MSTPDIRAEKRAAAVAAAAVVEDGMCVGLGTGTTVAELVPVLGERGLAITCVATSPATEELARAHGLDVRPFTDVDHLDVAIDGADQVDPAGWLVKGGGGAHTRERIVAAAADRFFVIVSSNKPVPHLRRAGPARVARVRPGRHHARLARRRPAGHPADPDGGVLADYHGEVGDPAVLSERLDAVPGLVSHGLFPPSMVHAVFIARGEDVEVAPHLLNKRPGSVLRNGASYGVAGSGMSDPTTWARQVVCLVSVNVLPVATTKCPEAVMSQVRVHNFSISLDGFGTGEGLTFEDPFGHAGHRLHEWCFATRFWHSKVGDAGGSVGVDDSFAERIDLGFGAEIMGRGKFGPQHGPWTDVGTDDEWRGWWGPNPPFHTPVFVLTHHARPPIEMRAATCSISSTPLRRRPSTSPWKRPATSTCASAAARRSCATSSRPTSSTRSMSCRCLILLGRGVRLWDGLEGVEERYGVEAVSSPSGVTHLTLTRR